MKKTILSAVVLAAAVALAGCSTSPSTARGKRYLGEQARSTVRQFRRAGVLTRSLHSAYAYAVYPNVTTAAVGVGGAYGKGEVFRKGHVVAYTDVTQGSIGVQLGGQTFSELVLFKNRAAFDRFKRGQLVLAAQATAVAASHGASVAPDYQRGVAVYLMHQGGLMFQAAVGGQQFGYRSRVSGSHWRRTNTTRSRTTNGNRRRTTTTTTKTKRRTTDNNGG